MTDDQLKEICIRRGFALFTTDLNWCEFRPLIMDLMNAAPLARLSEEEILNVARGRFHPPAALEFARELLNVAQIKKATALDAEKVDFK